jgi:hypothetical protein
VIGVVDSGLNAHNDLAAADILAGENFIVGQDSRTRATMWGMARLSPASLPQSPTTQGALQALPISDDCSAQKL